MKPFAVFFALVCALLLTVAPHVRAQDSQATPAPTEAPPADLHAYDDPAMHFEAPTDYRYLMERHIPLKNLGDPAIVAAWVKKPGDSSERDLYITVEGYDGSDASGFEQQAENDARNDHDDAFVENKTEVTTNNGMPAYFMRITYGSGFDARKQYQLVWTDGQRGVSVVLVGPIGDVTDQEARAVLLTNVTAVQYPFRSR